MADQKLPLEAEQLELLSAVRGGLQVGEKVLLLRWQGGQKYLVLDRVSEAGAGANERGVVM